MKIVYVSGGITNVPDFVEKFKQCEERLLKSGFEVINPAHIKLHKSATWEEYMKVCIEELKMADTIYMMDGWRKSYGACVEYGFALASGKTILQEGGEIDYITKL